MSPLTGTWELVTWYNETASGKRFYPLGNRATGYINYSHDGFVFVHVSAAGRALYAVNDPFGGTPEEDAAAIKSQMTYAGRYEYHIDHVIHRVTQSSCPNWVGTVQRRLVEFRGEELRLSAAGALFQGEKVTAIVDWRRAAV